jgi:hypothetical protein
VRTVGIAERGKLDGGAPPPSRGFYRKFLDGASFAANGLAASVGGQVEQSLVVVGLEETLSPEDLERIAAHYGGMLD